VKLLSLTGKPTGQPAERLSVGWPIGANRVWLGSPPLEVNACNSRRNVEGLKNMNVSLDKVLVVAEDASQRFHLRRTLDTFGFDPGEASNGVNALMRLRMIDYDAVLLHVPAFRPEGITLCRQLLGFNPRLPVLIVSDCDSLEHKLEALETGADDYMVRPVPERELSARLRSTIRRSRIPISATAERLVVGDIELDPATHRVAKAGFEISLTPLEFRALHFLMEQAGKLVTYESLLIALWGPGRVPKREHLRVLIGTLRKKLENEPADPRYLITHAYIGYCFLGQKQDT
jgi:two-component system KDP operon response regulator KdpE